MDFDNKMDNDNIFYLKDNDLINYIDNTPIYKDILSLNNYYSILKHRSYLRNRIIPLPSARPAFTQSFGT